jgi:hypothetical protein
MIDCIQVILLKNAEDRAFKYRINTGLGEYNLVFLLTL